MKWDLKIHTETAGGLGEGGSPQAGGTAGRNAPGLGGACIVHGQRGSHQSWGATRREGARASVGASVGWRRMLVFRTSRGFSVSCTTCGPRRLINARWPLFFSLSSSVMAEMLSPNLMVEERKGQAFQALCVQPHLVFVTL